MERVIINRRRPHWSSEINDYIDYGHAQVVSFDAFSALTGVLTLPPFPKVALVEQDNAVAHVFHPTRRGGPRAPRRSPRR